ncbi:hypothetical protein GPECTOR_58g547 [Gonium pectorale]|uniref:FAD-binding FR-type domain-containing protein n=1 Tax=Gonium pectorale TaxID=33097 RepID=A0A150G5K2_GONPE|nr:hypothetical protein GPECTOR_58g547 [Gonium pectorale]|eukprot:KXZ45098.1 hypothetical protein GPECTOR_58g547 [Gonium pectorale]
MFRSHPGSSISQSLDGSVRVLHLSVADHVDMLYGMRVKGIPDGSRWIESYTVPGQCVGVRPPAAPSDGPEAASAPPRRLFSIASSPYASRRDSAYVDASLIEGHHPFDYLGVCGGPASRASFLLAGLPGDLASQLAKQLSAKGVAYEHILFAQADFF